MICLDREEWVFTQVGVDMNNSIWNFVGTHQYHKLFPGLYTVSISTNPLEISSNPSTSGTHLLNFPRNTKFEKWVLLGTQVILMSTPALRNEPRISATFETKSSWFWNSPPEKIDKRRRLRVNFQRPIPGWLCRR